MTSPSGPDLEGANLSSRCRAQATRNVDTDAAWGLFAEHRARVLATLLEARRAPSDRLAILGAGNCNDLDLPALLAAFAAVDLVDLDASALGRGAARQGVAGHPGLTLRGGVDLSGQGALLDAWADRAPTPSEVDAFERAGPPALGLGPYEVVASTCLLTQLVAAVPEALPPEHPRVHAAALAERRRHLDLLLGLTASGGAALLVTDVVSSDTAPDLLRDEPADRQAQLEALVRAGNVFVGANPFAIDHALATRLGRDAVRLRPPWRWRLSATRAYLVAALEARL